MKFRFNGVLRLFAAKYFHRIQLQQNKKQTQQRNKRKKTNKIETLKIQYKSNILQSSENKNEKKKKENFVDETLWNTALANKRQSK